MVHLEVIAGVLADGGGFLTADHRADDVLGPRSARSLVAATN